MELKKYLKQYIESFLQIRNHAPHKQSPNSRYLAPLRSAASSHTGVPLSASEECYGTFIKGYLHGKSDTFTMGHRTN